MTLSTAPTPTRPADGDRPHRGRRPAAGIVAGALAAALGLAGLVAGARGQPGEAAAPGGPAPAAAPTGAAPAGGSSVGDITVTGVYIRQPAAPDAAAAYLTIRNAGSEPDSLESVYSGAARTTTLHGQPGVVRAGAHVESGPIPVPANGSATLAPGRGHIMLEGLTGPLRPGDQVSLLLRFARAGQLLVEAPVIAIGAPAP